jgi:hypothetical protein
MKKAKAKEHVKTAMENQKNDIKISRRAFIKTTTAFGAAVAGIPYNLTDITNVFLKEDDAMKNTFPLSTY